MTPEPMDVFDAVGIYPKKRIIAVSATGSAPKAMTAIRNATSLDISSR